MIPAQYANECFDSVVYVHDLAGNANDIEVNHILGSRCQARRLSRKFRVGTEEFNALSCRCGIFLGELKVSFSLDVERMKLMIYNGFFCRNCAGFGCGRVWSSMIRQNQ